MDYTARTGSDGQQSWIIQLGQVVTVNQHQDYTVQLGQVRRVSSHQDLYSYRTGSDGQQSLGLYS
jgi:hypothetical protein